MSADFNHLSKEEKLLAENKVLKLKMMLENGATFGYGDAGELSPQMENDFLHRIMEYEKFADNPKTIPVFEHLGKPDFFRAATEITDSEIDTEWEKLSDFLEEHHISLTACSPNVSNRELYRFTIEELFFEEIDDFDMPGAMFCFTYDEFHPDPVYEISLIVEEYLFAEIFQKKKLFSEHYYASSGFLFNDRVFSTWSDFERLLNKFKSFFDTIQLETCIIENVHVENNKSIATGVYRAKAIDGNTEIIYQGKFVILLAIGELGYWHFENMKIDGFHLG